MHNSSLDHTFSKGLQGYDACLEIPIDQDLNASFPQITAPPLLDVSSLNAIINPLAPSSSPSGAKLDLAYTNVGVNLTARGFTADKSFLQMAIVAILESKSHFSPPSLTKMEWMYQDILRLCIGQSKLYREFYCAIADLKKMEEAILKSGKRLGRLMDDLESIIHLDELFIKLQPDEHELFHNRDTEIYRRAFRNTLNRADDEVKELARLNQLLEDSHKFSNNRARGIKAAFEKSESAAVDKGLLDTRVQAYVLQKSKLRSKNPVSHRVNSSTNASWQPDSDSDLYKDELQISNPRKKRRIDLGQNVLPSSVSNIPEHLFSIGMLFMIPEPEPVAAQISAYLRGKQNTKIILVPTGGLRRKTAAVLAVNSKIESKIDRHPRENAPASIEQQAIGHHDLPCKDSAPPPNHPTNKICSRSRKMRPIEAFDTKSNGSYLANCRGCMAYIREHSRKSRV